MRQSEDLKKPWNIFRNKYIIWYQNALFVLQYNLLKQTERRFLTSWCILRSPSVWFWISIEFCSYQHVTLTFLWNPIFKKSRAVGDYSRHLPFNVVDKRPRSSKWHQLFFCFQTMYLQDIKSNQVYSKVYTQSNWAPRVFVLSTVIKWRNPFRWCWDC